MKCQDARKRLYCPTAPDREIPTGFLTNQSLPIALLGAKASGKSNYIAVLINEIRKKMTSRFNCTLDINCSEESKRHYDNNYYDPLFHQARVVEASDKGVIPPLIFPLRFMDNRNRITKVAALTFYDTAGENFDSDDDILVFNRYIPNSKGIILLLDPLQVPAIRKRLEGKMPLPAQNTDAVEILSRVIENIRAIKNIKGNINIPIALVFTKMDALETHGLLPEGSCLSYESDHLKFGAFSKSDFENTKIEMETLLENWVDDEIQQMLKQFSKYAIFGVTSLGAIPLNNRISSTINPRRVLDPLLWVLSENKYIKVIK